jgi:predicted RNA-binding Zn ribbon-like protein
MAKAKAPGELEAVQDFINTLEWDTQADEIATATGLGHWLAEHGFVHAKVKPTGAELDRAKALREALRNMTLANGGHALQVGAVDDLNAAAREAGLHVSFDKHGRPTLSATTSGVPGALGDLIAIVFRAMNEGTWARLKACPRATCLYAFYDSSKNKSGTWCSMAVCGNREKAKEFRRRHAPHAHGT